MSNNVGVWKNGESVAVQFLIKSGYRILQTNFRCRIGEIDIIAQHKKSNVLVFVEVKAKTNTNFGLPIEMVTPNKQNKIKQVAMCYLQQTGEEKECRFDVVDVLNGNINHIENAF